MISKLKSALIAGLCMTLKQRSHNRSIIMQNIHYDKLTGATFTMKIAIMAAMEEEIRSIRQLIEDPSEVRIGWYPVVQGAVQNHHLITLLTDGGKALAAAGTQLLIDRFQPDLVIFVGAAGALSPNLTVGDMVIGTKFKQHDFDITPLASDNYTGQPWVETNAQLLAYLQSVQDGHHFKFGSILTGDQSIANTQQKNRLYQDFKGDCVEMEGWAVACVSRLNITPFVVIRVITDHADDQARESFAETLVSLCSSFSTLVADLFFDVDVTEVQSWS